MTKTKTNKAGISIVNWAGISKFLTNSTENIRENRVPNKHQSKIDLLFYYIKCWKEGKRLYSINDIDEVLSKIDLKASISDELKILHGEETQ